MAYKKSVLLSNTLFLLEAHSRGLSGLFHDLHHIPGNLHIPAEYLFVALGNQFADSLNFIKPLILWQFQFLPILAFGFGIMIVALVAYIVYGILSLIFDIITFFF